MYRESLRIARLFFGLFLYAVGIVLTIRANMGFSPWDVFHQGVSQHLHITMGMANIGVAVIIVAATALMKEHVGFGTLCNMVAIGAFIDVLLEGGHIPVMQSFIPGVVMMVGGLFVIALASVFYIGAGYGAGPRDSLMVVLTRHTGKPVGFCRWCVEGTVLAIGWLLGGYAGIGTVIAAFGIGFAVQIVFGLLHFDVKKVHQESFYETWLRFRKFLQGLRKADMS